MALPIFPILAGSAVALFALFAGGKAREDEEEDNPIKDAIVKEKVEKKKETMNDAQKDALVKASKAKKEQDWQALVVNALATGDPDIIKEAIAVLKAAGKKEQAAMLAKALKQLEANIKRESRKRAPTKREAPVVVKKETKKQPTLAKPKAEPKALPAGDSPERAFAKQTRDHLNSTTRYNENKAMVKKYQELTGLVADGMYGPKSARAMWSVYRIMPPNPYYWSKATASKDIAAYREFLDSIALDSPKKIDEVTQLKKTVGK